MKQHLQERDHETERWQRGPHLPDGFGLEHHHLGLDQPELAWRHRPGAAGHRIPALVSGLPPVRRISM